MADIFLSYARLDRGKIKPLVDLLEARGLDVWWDPDLVAGELYNQVIKDELAHARCVLVAWSVSSADSVWVRDEAGRGHRRNVLVPFTVDGTEAPLGFGQYQTPDLDGWTGDPADPRVQQLLAGVRRVLGEPDPPPRQEAAPAEPVRAGEPPTEPVSAVRTESPAPGRRWRLTRRQALLIGAGVVVAAGGVGLYEWWPVSLPPSRRVDFALVTVDAQGSPTPSQPQSAEVFDVTVGTVPMSFSMIPAGAFAIGSPDTEPERQSNEGPQQQVSVRAFAIGRCAVTQAQWAAVVDAVPDPIAQTLPRRPSFFVGENLPVETISWLQATEFCARMSRASGLRIRLPSEAEWEYACRAGTTTPFHFGPTVTPDLANYCGTGGAVAGSSEGRDVTSSTYGGHTYTSGAYAGGPEGIFNAKTTEVGTYPPNRFGLYEVHGNVWEHCADVGRVDYRQIPVDGAPVVAAQDVHVLRGGAWSHNPAICRSAYRDSIRSGSPGWQGRVGLRVVCELGGR